MNAPPPAIDETPEYTGLVRNSDWKQNGSLELYIHRDFVPQMVYKGKFPHYVETDGQEWVRTWHSYISPDQIDPETFHDPHQAQKRLKAKHDYRYWYGDRRRGGKRPDGYESRDPLQLCKQWITDEIRDGRIAPDQIVFRFEWVSTPKSGKPEKKILELEAAKFSNAVKPLDDEWQTYDQKVSALGYFLAVLEQKPDAGLQIIETSGSFAGGQPEKSRVPISHCKFGRLYKAILTEQRADEEFNEKMAKKRGAKGGVKRDPLRWDPCENPYPIAFKFNPHESGMNMYSIQLKREDFEQGAYEYTPEIESAISDPVPENIVQDLEFYTEPRDGACEELYQSMKRGAENAGFKMPIDDFFAPWRELISAKNGEPNSENLAPESSTPTVCACGLILDKTWDSCPYCGVPHSGNSAAPNFDEIVYEGSAEQKCAECGHVCLADAGTCPECHAELPVQVLAGDDYDDLDGDI